MPVEFEQRVRVCEACGTSYVLEYGRASGDIRQRLENSVTANATVTCPNSKCGRQHQVWVPVGAVAVVAKEWLGGQAPTSTRRA